ncbi:Tol-Pal system beta propeller repeat protein TolB [Xinfangfangia sp. CPCC 101601]|uniref:Tol-Pal system protein TolB n=1 Tax=Pseudogemmobacter lacusdianii TaxID=3069608 RepID=A0ABU0VZV2_9RHOB|nr:Tol-Pal system beta propeller repeat protein TolB [Xinfangfangia sp. CPCC 101601]MDQ2067287.1 Tol-Pal system beta propeller repeat protein TolB [Xinfangfangia sp. CPCC 101601]
MKPSIRILPALLALAMGPLATLPAMAQEPLRIVIDQAVIDPMPVAVPVFVDEGGAGDLARNLSRVVAADLAGTGLFREIPQEAHISRIGSFDGGIAFEDWRAVNARVLVTGAVSASGGRVTVKFRAFDVVNGSVIEGAALQFAGTTDGWRRMAHKVSDVVYSKITGEGGYFDSRVVFVSESGPKNARAKRLAVMDYDGANVQYLTDSAAIVLAPRFSPAGDRILYTSYETGFPRITLMDVGSLKRQTLGEQPGTMTFAPRFSPDGGTVVFSLERGGNTDIYSMNLRSGGLTQLTNSPSIETAPSFSPDGSQIVFESDRSGAPQIYIMPASGGEGRRISGGEGRYGTPVWSPRGDLVAFTKQNKGRFHIGVMRTDGSEERLLTASFLDEGPTWAPNGRVIMFTRETSGDGGQAGLWSVDISGRNLKQISTDGPASDPAWSPLLP